MIQSSPFEFSRLFSKAHSSITGYTARINLWHGAVRSGKTISSLIACQPGARFYVTTNPDGLSHWLKKSYIDRAPELNLRQEYTGLWYRGYVLGEWTLTEGAVYDCLG